MRTGVPWLFFSFCPADSPQLTAFSGSLKLAAIMKPLSSENALTSPPPLSRGTALTSPNKPPLRRQPCPLLNWWIAPPRCSDRRQPMCRSKGNVPICLRHLSMYTDHYSRTVETWIIHSHSNMKLWCAPVMLGEGDDNSSISEDCTALPFERYCTPAPQLISMKEQKVELIYGSRWSVKSPRWGGGGAATRRLSQGLLVLVKICLFSWHRHPALCMALEGLKNTQSVTEAVYPVLSTWETQQLIIFNSTQSNDSHRLVWST